MFGFFQLNSSCRKLPVSDDDARFKSFIERQQPCFQLLTFADLVIAPGDAARATGIVSSDLALSGNPMDAVIGMRNAKFSVIRACLAGSFCRQAKFRHVVDKDRGLP